MATVDAGSGMVETREADQSLVTLTHVIYALHATSILIGVLTGASILTAFLFSIPSIIALILNYIRHSDVRGTWLDSHFRWQIRTFWYAALWFVIGWLLIFTLLGAIIGIPVLVLLVVWVIYRVGRGWLTLRDRRPMAAMLR